MKKKVIHTLMALVLTLTIISVSVVFTLAFRPLYYADINALNIPERTGYSEEMIRENYDVLIDYNLSFGEEELEFPSLPMSESGRIHFEEVKDIFNLFKYTAIAGVILSALGIYQYVADWGGAGAAVPLTGFGNTLAKGVREAVAQQGLLGALTGGITATAGGIAAAIFFGFLVALIFKAKPKR